MKKLVAVEIELKEDVTEEYKKGEKYSYFQDPETKKWYRPADGFTVTSESDLSDRFIEVPTGEEK